MSRKQELRRLLLHMRREMPPQLREHCNQALRTQFLAWCGQRSPGVLALYMPIRGEPDLLPVCETLLVQGWQLALPVVQTRDAPLAFAPWRPGEALHKDLVGVPAPTSSARIRPEIIVMPCLGYNHLRFRLGYGAGYYDRTLAALPGVRSIGVAWSESQVGFIADPFDLALEAVITEKGLVEDTGGRLV